MKPRNVSRVLAMLNIFFLTVIINYTKRVIIFSYILM